MAKLRIETSKGDIIVRLYDETPKHRDNILKLAGEGFYDGTLFHRVIKDFMIRDIKISYFLHSRFIYTTTTVDY